MSRGRRPGRFGAACQQLADLVALLSSERRRQILLALAAGPKDGRSLADETGLSVSGLRWHVQRLRQHGLVTVERRARRNIYRQGRLVSTIVGREKAVLSVAAPRGTRVTLVVRRRGPADPRARWSAIERKSSVEGRLPNQST